MTTSEVTHVRAEALVGAIRRHLPHAVVAVDAPSDLAGRWFIDVEVGSMRHVIEVRRGARFGLSVGDSGAYGEGPDEVFGDDRAVVARLAKPAALAR
jgi:hypothetical protein